MGAADEKELVASGEERKSSREITEETLRIVRSMAGRIEELTETVDQIKKKIGFNDVPLAKPQGGNANTDTGPWPQSQRKS